MVRMSTLVEDPLSKICRAASNPSSDGMLMSRMLTSGFNSLAFSTASLPLLASATTFQPGCFSRRSRRPRRTMS